MSVSDSQTRTDTIRPKNHANILRQVRQLHLYLGPFFASAILLFAFSGAFQLFGLHEGRPGSSYRPPTWIDKLAQVHKHQTLAMQPKKPRTAARRIEPAEKEHAPGPGGPPHDSLATLALKWFFLFMSAGFIITTLLGIYMSFKYNRNRRMVWALLLIGTALPIALLIL